MKDWPLWEVFVRSKGGMSHRHVGSYPGGGFRDVLLPGEHSTVFPLGLWAVA